MNRIPEPDIMGGVEQARAYAAADFSEPHNAFVQYFKDRFPDFTEGDVLDLGCGAADVTIRFATAYPSVHITGVDGSKAMLDIARKDISAAELNGRVRVLNCYLPDRNLSTKKFNAVISNSLLHHLADPGTLWNTAIECTEHDSRLFMMDLFRPETTAEARDLVSLHAAEAPEILKKDFYNSLLAAYTIKEVRQQIQNFHLEHLKVEAVSDRHIIVWGRT